MRRWLLALLIVGQAAAQEARITELQLEGCRVTEPQKVLAAIGFQPGMPYDAKRLQKALMDLGLFESVTLETTQIPQGVRVTAKVQEKTHPAPKTEEAARALNPVAVARQLLSFQQKPSLLLFEQDGRISLNFPGFQLVTEVEDEMLKALVASIGGNTWMQKAFKVSDDKTACERLIAELRRHLRKNPNDAWAQFALAYLLMAQGHHDEAEQQISTLLARQPDFHPAYVLRLFSAFLRLVAFLKARTGKQFEVSLQSDFPLPSPDPVSPGIVRWVIDEVVTHFRRLSDKAFDRDAILAATFFFSNAIAGELFLFFSETSESQADEEESDISASWERLAKRFADYLADYLRLSRTAERFAKDLTVQKAMADWGHSLLLSSLSFGFAASFSANLSAIDDPQQISQALMKALRIHLRLMRPYFERHKWHLERLTVKNSPYRADTFSDLVRCLSLLGDFSSAQKVMETALRETGKLDGNTLKEVLGLNAFSEGDSLTPTLVARYVAWLDGLERQHPLPVSVALWLSYWRLWLAAKGDAEAMWEKVPEAERREALNRLRRSVQQFPSDAGSWWSLGIMALALNDVPTASEAFTKATELDPKNVAYRYALGLVALAQGDFQRAIELLKAMETNP